MKMTSHIYNIDNKQYIVGIVFTIIGHGLYRSDGNAVRTTANPTYIEALTNFTIFSDCDSLLMSILYCSLANAAVFETQGTSTQ